MKGEPLTALRHQSASRPDLPFDIVELVPCPEPPAPAEALREMALHKDAWLPDEDAVLRRMFADDVHIEDIAAEPWTRGFQAVRSRVQVLGLRRNSTRRWTEMDLAYFAERYGRDPSSAIALALGRSPNTVQTHAQLEGLSSGGGALGYTPWEDAQVRAGYTAGVPPSQIGVLIGRTMWGVMGRASFLDLRHPNLRAAWSHAEGIRVFELAREGMIYPRIAATLEAEGYPPRSKNAVGFFLHDIGYSRGWGRPWTEDEEELLRRAYANGDSLIALAESFCRTKHSLKWKADELDLQGTHPNHDGFRQGPVWTAAQDAFLIANYGRGKMKTAEIAGRLNRNKGGVLQRAHVLDLEHGYCRDWTEPELLAVRIGHDTGLSMTDVAESVGRDVAVVHRKALQLDLHFSQRAIKAPRTPRATRPKVTLASILAMPNLQSDTVQLKYAAFSQGTDDMAQEQELASALRGTKTVARAFFTAVDAMPEPQRRAVAAAALDLIRDDMKAQREQAAAVAAKAKTAKAPAKTARAPAKAARKAAKKAAPVRRARKTKAPAAAPAAPQAQTGNGAAAEA